MSRFKVLLIAAIAAVAAISAHSQVITGIGAQRAIDADTVVFLPWFQRAAPFGGFGRSPTARSDTVRRAGILMPLFSLPSPCGIGTLGAEAYRFIDFLAAAVLQPPRARGCGR